MSGMDKAIQEVKEVREQKEKRGLTQNQLDEFEAVTRKNAGAIHEFCRESGMSVIEAGAACDWVVVCIKKAMSAIPDDLT